MMRPLLVVGPPRSGKSEVAQRLAECTGRSLLVADATNLEAHLAHPVQPAPVIDVSSETWLNRGTRLLALDRCIVVSVRSIDGHDGTLALSDDNSRELSLWKCADVAFCEAHEVVRFERQKLASIVEAISAIWQRDPIAVAVGQRSYVVDIGRGITEQRCKALLGGHATIMLVTDSNVNRLHGVRVDGALLATGSRLVKVVLGPGEEQKHMGTLGVIFEHAQRGGIDRGSPIVGVGGGVVTDVAGFAAATWMRGLRWFALPTTLLGMVDASVGGKTAVDFGEAKNAIGAFWQPKSVVCDIDWLETESVRNYISALSEVIKTAIIGDPSLFAMIEHKSESILARDPDVMVDVVRRCIRVKARIVGLDEREGGLRASLKFGAHSRSRLGSAGWLWTMVTWRSREPRLSGRTQIGRAARIHAS